MSTIFLIFQSWSVSILTKFRSLVLDFSFSNFIDLKLRPFVLNVFRFWKTLDPAFWLARSFCCQKLSSFKFKDNCNLDVPEAIDWLDQKVENTRWWFSCNGFRSNDLCNSRSALRKFAFCRVSSSFDFFLSKWSLNDIFFLSKIMSLSSWESFFMNSTFSISESDDIDWTSAYKKGLLFWRRVQSSFVDGSTFMNSSKRTRASLSYVINVIQKLDKLFIFLCSHIMSSIQVQKSRHWKARIYFFENFWLKKWKARHRQDV